MFNLITLFNSQILKRLAFSETTFPKMMAEYRILESNPSPQKVDFSKEACLSETKTEAGSLIILNN
jgi:hypothetical protein